MSPRWSGYTPLPRGDCKDPLRLAFSSGYRPTPNSRRASSALWSFGVGACLAVGFTPAVQALSVDPTVVELRAPADAKERGVFRVINDTDEAIVLSVELESLAPASYAPHEPSEWVKVSPSHLKLLPNEASEVEYVVSVPSAAHGELAAEVVFVQDSSGGAPSGIQIRFGMALYVSIAGTERLDLSVGPLHLLTGQAPAALIPITNLGNVHCRPEGSVTLRNAGGDMIASGILSRGMPAPPGRMERFRVSLEEARTIVPGTYRILADLTCHATAEIPMPIAVDQTGHLDTDGKWSANRDTDASDQ